MVKKLIQVLVLGAVVAGSTGCMRAEAKGMKDGGTMADAGPKK